MKMHGGVDVYTRAFLTSVLAGDKWSALRPDRFPPPPPKEIVLGTLCIGGWVGSG
jgi:hypothetical protein